MSTESTERVCSEPRDPATVEKTPARFARLLCCGLVLIIAGCAAQRTETVKPTPAIFAQEAIPEEHLLDVGIQVFDYPKPGTETTRDKPEDLSNPEVKRAESHYVPYHLKNTLQLTANWGSVRVTPVRDEGADVLVSGSILASNGSELRLQVKVVDASGRLWLDKIYEAQTEDASYSDTRKGLKDPFQDLYNTLSNDMLAARDKLTGSEISRLRDLSRLRFAADVAPEAFGDYVHSSPEGQYTLNRLPADGDPMMLRVLQVREREFMFMDTVNTYYGNFYDDMWEPYLSWRKAFYDEAKAQAELERKARYRQLLGAAAIAAAIAYEIAGGSYRSPTVRDLMVIGGLTAIKSGSDLSKDAEIHEDVLQELGESFAADVKPVVMDVEGRTVELNGSAEQQYHQWRALLRDIFVVETGLPLEKAGQQIPPAAPVLSGH